MVVRAIAQGGRPRRPLAAGLAVFALGFVVVWAAGPPFEVDVDRLCGTAGAEGSSYTTSPSLTLPGATECVVTTPEGSHKHNYVPWTDWLAMALLSAAVAAGAQALGSKSRVVPLTQSGCLVVGGLAAYFVTPIAAAPFVAVAVLLLSLPFFRRTRSRTADA